MSRVVVRLPLVRVEMTVALIYFFQSTWNQSWIFGQESMFLDRLPLSAAETNIHPACCNLWPKHVRRSLGSLPVCIAMAGITVTVHCLNWLGSGLLTGYSRT